MTSDATVLIFKSICNFIRDLNESFGTDFKSLYLYSALIEKTGIIHEEPIKKHIHIFSEFCKENEQAIIEKDVTQFHSSIIRYSDKVYIDLIEVFKKADKEEKDIMWKHLLALLALLHPSSQAKSLLKKQGEQNKNSGGEEEFLSNIIDKVGKHIDPTAASPVEMMNNIMSSGVFQDVVNSMNSGLSEGNLDLNKMLGSLQNMIGNLSTMAEAKEERNS